MKTKTTRSMPLQSKMRFAFTGFLILLFVWTSYEAWGFASLARYLPLTVSLLALAGMLVSLALDVVGYRRSGIVAGDDVPMTAALAGAEVEELRLEHTTDPGRASGESQDGGRNVPAPSADDPISDQVDQGAVEPPVEILKRSGVVFAWIVGYVAAIAIIGIMAASGLFLLGYLFVEAKTGWKVPVFGTAIVLGLMGVMRELLNLEWPGYLLESVVESLI